MLGLQQCYLQARLCLTYGCVPQVFMDNGGGMTPDTLHKMLGFGHSDKKEVDGHRCV